MFQKILLRAVGITMVGYFVINYFIRVSGPYDKYSTGYMIYLIQNKKIGFVASWFLASIIIIILLQSIYYFFRGVSIPGVGKFWRLVANNPNMAYHWFKQSGAWCVINYPPPPDYKDKFPETEWADPFDLYVPEIGSRVLIFGKTGLYEHTRYDFIRMIINAKQKNRKINA